MGDFLGVLATLVLAGLVTTALVWVIDAAWWALGEREPRGGDDHR